MITVIGLGFVGLTTALGFCEKGFKVYGIDIDQNKMEQLSKGKVPFFEPYLNDKLKNHLQHNFELTDSLSHALQNSKIIFFCVGTPSQPDGSVDLQYIFSSIESVLQSIQTKKYKVFVIKSTIPPSTTKNFIKPYIEKLGFHVGADIGLTNNPEFLREGHAWEDFQNPDRIVIGEEDDTSGGIVEAIYRAFDAPIHRVSLNTAEYIKYLSNTLLATLISFSNEQSMIARSVGDIEIKRAFQILHEDKRWFGNPANMSSYVFPGCGFGGYCLPKDTNALIQRSSEYSYSPEILKSVLKVNTEIKERVVYDITNQAEINDSIGILGLSFKPNSDDVRDTPAKEIIRLLLEKGYTNIHAYDPIATSAFRKTFQFPIEYSTDLSSFLSKVNHVVILTAWNEFAEKQDQIKQKNVFDYRYLLN